MTLAKVNYKYSVDFFFFLKQLMLPQSAIAALV